MKIAQFTLPGGQTLEPPGGIPTQLRGGLNTSGAILVQTALNWLFLIAAILTVIFMIYSGIQWITSGGDPGKIAQAKSRLFYAIIGLVVVAAAFLIVRVIITILGGDPSFFFKFGG